MFLSLRNFCLQLWMEKHYKEVKSLIYIKMSVYFTGFKFEDLFYDLSVVEGLITK